MIIEYQDPSYDEESGRPFYVEGEDIDGFKFDDITHVIDLSEDNPFTSIDYFIKDGKILEPEEVIKILSRYAKGGSVTKEDYIGHSDAYRLTFPINKYPSGMIIVVAKPSIVDDVEKRFPELYKSDYQPDVDEEIRKNRGKMIEEMKKLGKSMDMEILLGQAST